MSDFVLVIPTIMLVALNDKQTHTNHEHNSATVL